MVKLKYNGPYSRTRIVVCGIEYYWDKNEIKDVSSSHSKILLQNGSFSIVEKKHKKKDVSVEDTKEKKSTVEKITSSFDIESETDYKDLENN